MVGAFVSAVERCPNFDAGNALADLLPSIEGLTSDHVDRLVTAFNENDQVSGSYGFKGSWPSVHGDGLAAHLTRIVGEGYTLSTAGRLGMQRSR
jgi:hypothetical protein